MSNAVTRRPPVPAGWHTVTPRIVVTDARRFVEFLAQIFSATGEYEESRPSIIWLGDSPVMVSEIGVRTSMPAFLYVYVLDADATYQRALEAGVRVIEPPLETPYGDRRCMFEDHWGNTWQVATYRGSPNAA